MGRFIVVLFVFGLSTPAFCAVSGYKDAGLQNLLQQSYEDFQNLALDLPFAKITGGRDHTVRERFRAAARTLMEAAREIDRDGDRSRELTRDALNKFRRVGLLLPFIEMDHSDEAMDKYLAAEDRLFFSLKVFEGSETCPATEDVWRYNGLAWRPLKGAVSLREAQEKCAAVMASRTAGWRVPNLDELLGTFAIMKNPTRNPIFGAEAAGFRQVWTATPSVQDPTTYYYVDFESAQLGPLGSAQHLPRYLRRDRYLDSWHV